MAAKSNYTAVPTATAVSTTPPFDEHTSAVASRVDVPDEARHLTWDDAFFEADSYEAQEIIAVFDFDRVTMIDFNTKVGFASMFAACIYPPIAAIMLLGLYPCFLRRNVEWNANAQHIALTRDGIRFVKDRRQTCWGLPCTDAGRSSKTVPYDKITDCDVELPAGNTCICIKNVLATVNVDTASSGGPSHELKISGLKDPVGFKRLVWAMKRFNSAHRQSGVIGDSSGGVIAKSMTRGYPDKALDEGISRGSNEQQESISLLLREIRDELRELRLESSSKGKDVSLSNAAAEMVERATATATATVSSGKSDNADGSDDSTEPQIG